MEFKGKYKDLVIPRLNVNDTRVIISNIQKESLEYIEEGDLLFCTETSKSAEDYEADFSGYLVLFVKDLDEVEVGKSAGMIFKLKEDAEVCLMEFEAAKNKNELGTVNASKKALEYAKRIGFNLSLINKNGIIKTEDIDNYLKTKENSQKPKHRIVTVDLPINYTYDTTTKRVAIIGGGRGAMQILDLISHIDGYTAVRIFEKDEARHGSNIYGVPVVYENSMEDIVKDYKNNLFDYIVNGIGGSTQLRKEYYDTLVAEGVQYCNLIHPSVIIGQGVKMGSGNILLPMCHVGPEACIGNDNFLSAKTSIEHHNIIGSHCTFGPGVLFSGSVEVGDCVKFAAGIFAEPLVKVGDNSIIASGVILTKNIPENIIVRNQQKIEFVNLDKFK